MELAKMIDDLSRPEAYPESVAGIEVVQTHISLVFLAGSFVYKIKKPVQMGFLDFSSLEKRLFFCGEEVRLNRRLAPQVYLGVVPVTQDSSGCLHLEGEGEPIDWAVKMQRLPQAATLESRLESGAVDEKVLRQLAKRLAEFHRQADCNEKIWSLGGCGRKYPRKLRPV